MARTLNPLSTRHSVLPPQIVLLAKLVVIAVVFKGYAGPKPSGVAAFEFLERIAEPEVYGYATCALILAGSSLVLLNLALRVGAFCVGLGLLCNNMGNLAEFSHSGLFAALLLILVSLWSPNTGSRFLRLQVVVLYCGAGLNKALDHDWWSGQYLSFYSSLRLGPAYEIVEPTGALPSVILFMSLATIVFEVGAAIALLFPSTVMLGLVLSSAVHVGILVWTGHDYGVFFYSVFASYLAFVAWPARMKLDAPRAPAGRWVIDALKRLDVDCLLDTVERPPRESLALSVEREHFSGFNAWVYLFLHFPPVLLLLLALLVWPTGGTGGALATIRVLIVATLYALVMAQVLASTTHKLSPRGWKPARPLGGGGV